jgi:hypothetical protein
MFSSCLTVGRLPGAPSGLTAEKLVPTDGDVTPPSPDSVGGRGSGLPACGRGRIGASTRVADSHEKRGRCEERGHGEDYPDGSSNPPVASPRQGTSGVPSCSPAQGATSIGTSRDPVAFAQSGHPMSLSRRGTPATAIGKSRRGRRADRRAHHGPGERHCRVVGVASRFSTGRLALGRPMQLRGESFHN